MTNTDTSNSQVSPSKWRAALKNVMASTPRPAVTIRTLSDDSSGNFEFRSKN